MWVASKYGFYSIVQKEEVFHVRARSKEDLEGLKDASGIPEEVLKSYAGSDYPWRLIVSGESLLKVFSALQASVDYGNFKGMIGNTPSQTDKLRPYHDIWSTMYSWQKSKR